ncbi:MAG: signal peptidase I [Clostridiales bacterium]|nr:signal peptidase I [Clostridiales bacterium]
MRQQIPENQTGEDAVPSPGWRKDVYDWLQTLAIVLVFITVFFTFFGMIFGVSGSSMYPTLHDGDAMLIQRIGYTPRQGDIVVLKKDGFPYADDSEAIVKRVIAVAGQEVEIDYDSNTIYVDGVALEEDYLNFANEGVEQYGDDYMVERDGMVYSSFQVPEGCIFVMGDNRNGSTDSRYAALGMVDTRYVLGKAVCVFFPFSDARWLS